MFLALDVGNSRIHAGRFAGERLVERIDVSCPTGETPGPAFPAELAGRLAEGVTHAAVASVNPRVSDALLEWLRVHCGGEPRRIGGPNGISVPLTNRTRDPAGVGVDRLLNAYGAWRRAGSGCVVVACGSAITVDVVTRTGAFLGGAILPGLSTGLDALHARCAQLPALVPERTAAAVGTDTRAAMLAGVVLGAVGAIRHLAERMRAEAGEELRGFLTGGDAELLAPLLGDFGEVAPDLTLHAIRACAGDRT